MKKLLLTAAFVGLSVPAMANEMNWKPYIGADFQHTAYEYQTQTIDGLRVDYDALLEDSLNGFNIHVGNRFNKFFGLELGYFNHSDEDKDVPAGTVAGIAAFTTNVDTHGVTLDGLGYIPIDESGMFELIGTVGLSWTDAEVTVSANGLSASEDEEEIGFRLGGGGQVNITDNISLRGLIRYQTADFDDVADNAWTYTAGFNFSF